MHRRNGLLILLTIVVVLATTYLALMAFNVSGLPLAVRVVGAHTGVIVPVPGLPLPNGLYAGERIDLAAQLPSTRIAIAQLHTAGQLLPLGQAYTFTVHRGISRMTVAVTSASWDSAPGFGLIAWLRFFEGLFSGAIALVVVWRGRDRAAASFALFAVTFLAALPRSAHRPRDGWGSALCWARGHCSYLDASAFMGWRSLWQAMQSVWTHAVPLGLGVSLSTVHRRIDDTVDRLIFRRQYREEVALRRFASESAFVTQPETLLDLTVDQLHLHVGAPWVAFYEYTPEGYTRVRQRGTQDLPQTVAICVGRPHYCADRSAPECTRNAAACGSFTNTGAPFRPSNLGAARSLSSRHPAETDPEPSAGNDCYWRPKSADRQSGAESL